MLCTAIFTLVNCKTSEKAALSKKDLPTDSSAADYFLAGEQFKLKQNPEKAIYNLRRFYQLEPQNATAPYELSRLFNEVEQLDSALYYGKIAADLDTTNQWIQQFYAFLLEKDEDYGSAVVLYERLIRQHPQTPLHAFQRAAALAKEKRNEAALAQLDEIAEQFPTNYREEVLEEKRDLFLNAGMLDSAIITIRTLIKIQPDQGELYGMLADAYLTLDRPEKAIEAYQYYLSVEPNNIEAELGLGLLYKINGNDKEFRYYTLKAFKNPGMEVDRKIQVVSNFLNLAKRHPQSYGRQEMLWMGKTMLAYGEKNAALYRLYGDIFYQNQLVHNAAEQYENAVEFDSTNFENWERLLQAKTELENADDLLEYSRRAVDLFPWEGRAWISYGMALFLKKKYKQAIVKFKSAIGKEPKNYRRNTFIYKMISRAYQNMNKKKKAQDYRYRSREMDAKEHALREKERTDPQTFYP